MTEKLAKNVAASVRQRLLNLRESEGGDYNALLTQYAIERFLYRLSKSELAEHFVLKGAMLFRVWSGAMRRPTKDLDLLGRGDPSPNAVANAIRQVIAARVEDDGMTFDSSSIEAREIRDAQEYGGIRVTLVALLGNARIPMQIDVGFGDAVTPEAQVQPFPTLLDMDAPHLHMYPPETVIAEKVEAVVTLGMTNSRMKDYFDLLVLLRDENTDHERVIDALAATFERRRTSLPDEVPPGLSDEFGADERAQGLWRGFLRRMQIDDVPTDFTAVVDELRDRIWPLIVGARSHRQS
ncbi:MAG: nucleotidyl transferase AbiEii/AbiGii toxin family protein [Phycisphaerales bacterium]|jgi:predicted nucleotidyltransferase component of viral defense system|nr:nucleotidyl transferase AbiEii/AbiGii toxin family protein [Phycisphaerales bacterium]